MIPATATPHMHPGPPRILFLADACPGVGGGHVMRCLTLAAALVARDAVCGFVATPAAAAILDVFADAAIERVGVTGESPEAISAVAHRWEASAIVVDNYRFERGCEARLRSEISSPLIVIDDLRRHHDCDLVLDSNIGRTGEDYPGVATLTGPAFALVRAAFVERRKATLARRKRGEPTRRILVSLGLADLGGITARVVQALLPDLGEANLDVVLGEGALSLAPLTALAAREPRLRLYVNTQDMAALMAEADLAVGAGGSSTWERCCLGLPAITLILAENQRPNALALAAAGATLVLEADTPGFDQALASTFDRLRSDARAALSEASASLCDGLGAERTADRLMPFIQRSDDSTSGFI